MSEKEEEQFQSSNICWISEKLIDDNDEKVRDHCHVTGKFRGAHHWSCNINLQLTKGVPVIFRNLRGYDSHLIFNDIVGKVVLSPLFKSSPPPHKPFAYPSPPFPPSPPHTHLLPIPPFFKIVPSPQRNSTYFLKILLFISALMQ